MTIEQIFTEASLELERARRIHPIWPVDIVHASSIMMEEAGETLKEANNYYWGHKGGTLISIRREAIETIATCLRLLIETPCMAEFSQENQKTGGAMNGHSPSSSTASRFVGSPALPGRAAPGPSPVPASGGASALDLVADGPAQRAHLVPDRLWRGCRQVNAYTAGFEDARYGRIYDNPYTVGSTHWEQYDQGHQDGRSNEQLFV